MSATRPPLRSIRRALGAAAALLLAAAAFAEGPQKAALENGLPVVYQRDTSSSVTVLEILVRGGQAVEPADKAGLAYLTTRLAIDIPDQGKVQDFMVKALHYSMTARPDYALIHLECLSEYFEDALKAFVEIVEDPLFTGVRISRIKEVMDNQRRIQADDSDNIGHLAHLEHFFGGSGYGRSIYGTEDSLKSIKAVDLKDFYAAYFRPEAMVLAAVTDLEPPRLLAALQNSFGRFKKGRAPFSSPSAPAPKAPPAEARRIEKDCLQTLISVAYALPPLTRRTYALTALVENTLGRGPGTRLWSLRSELKLAYSVAALATPMKSAGLLESYLETEPAKAEEAGAALDKSLRDFREGGISPDELEAARIEVKAQFLRGNERKDPRTTTLGLFEALGLGADYFSGFAAEVDAVTPADVNAFLKDVLDPSRASWVLVGPKK